MYNGHIRRHCYNSKEQPVSMETAHGHFALVELRVINHEGTYLLYQRGSGGRSLGLMPARDSNTPLLPPQSLAERCSL